MLSLSIPVSPSPESSPVRAPRLDRAVRTALRDRLRALGAAGRAFHPRLRQAAGAERAARRDEKRAVGAEARLTLLALAFLRGRRYHAIEAAPRAPVGAEALARELRVWQPVDAWPEALVAAWLEAA